MSNTGRFHMVSKTATTAGFGTELGSDEPRSFLERIQFALKVRRERQALQALDEATLRDLGLSRADVEREANRGLLDLPRQNPTDRRYRI